MSLLLELLPGEKNEKKLKEIFEFFGSVSIIFIKTGDPPVGYALITYSHIKDAVEAYHNQIGLYPKLSAMFNINRHTQIRHKKIHILNFGYSARKSAPPLRTSNNYNDIDLIEDLKNNKNSLDE